MTDEEAVCHALRADGACATRAAGMASVETDGASAQTGGTTKSSRNVR